MVTPAPLQERCGQVALADRVETSEGFDGRWGRRGGEGEGERGKQLTVPRYSSRHSSYGQQHCQRITFPAVFTTLEFTIVCSR